jgi:hypothetical protein
MIFISKRNCDRDGKVVGFTSATDHLPVFGLIQKHIAGA